MAMLPLRLVPSFPASAARSSRIYSRPQQTWPTEIRVLVITLATALCLSVCTSIGWQHQGLDEQAMLYAMLAAGGMPLVYRPPAICTGPTKSAHLGQAEMRALFSN
jgi:hypothetical protein